MTVYKEKHPRTGKWRYRIHVIWTYPDGRKREIRKVSPVSTQRGAEQYERDIRSALADGTYDQVKQAQAGARTLTAFEARYFRDHVAKLKPSMQSAQRTIWRVTLLPVLGESPLTRIDEEAFAKLIGSMLERGLKPKTVNNALSGLRTALECAYDWKLISRIPDVPWLKVPKQKFDFFTFEEADLLVQVGVPMVTVALRTGMRIGELLALSWDDVSFERNAIVVDRSVFWEKGKAYEGSTKGGRFRSLPMTSEVRAALNVVQADPSKRRGHVFASPRGGRLTRNGARSVLRRALRWTQVRPAEFGWHVCRHTFASHLVMRGVPLPAVQQLMGHTTIQQTMKYAHLAPGHLQSAMAVLEPTDPPPAP